MFSLFKSLFASKPVLSGKFTTQELDHWADLAVERMDPRLKMISRYRKRLYPAVECALLHIKELIRDIPGPLEISRQTYGADPCVHTLFGSNEQLEHLFSHSREISEYAKQVRPKEQTHCYAFMIMDRNDKQRLGHALVGEQVQNDVMQRVVYFSNHALVKPSNNEEDVRDELCEHVFQHLLSEAIFKVANHKEQLAELDRQLAHQKAELKKLKAEIGGIEFLGTYESDAGDQTPSLVQQLEETKLQRDKLASGLQTLDDYFELLLKVLSHPHHHCGLENESIILNRFNVVQDDDSARDACTLPYAEIRTGELIKAGMIIKYPLDELVGTSRIAMKTKKLYQ
ncbi:MAG: hypothetical protein RPU52_08650 [Candidatus Sedimenticola sp. (ex Thyasira tokunagai)]